MVKMLNLSSHVIPNCTVIFKTTNLSVLCNAKQFISNCTVIGEIYLFHVVL
jgi:hypothetical protein